jgi:hypothetical protein
MMHVWGLEQKRFVTFSDFQADSVKSIVRLSRIIRIEHDKMWECDVIKIGWIRGPAKCKMVTMIAREINIRESKLFGKA